MKQTILFTQAPSSPLYLNIIYLLFIFITACSVIKEKRFFQADSLQKQNTRRETKTKESLRVDAVRVYNSHDSSDHQIFTEIFPEGLFKYSVNDGFIGIAKRVVINERLKASSKVGDSGRISSINNKLSNITESKRQLTKTRQKEKKVNTRNFTLWYLGGLLLIFAAVFVFRWKLND